MGSIEGLWELALAATLCNFQRGKRHCSKKTDCAMFTRHWGGRNSVSIWGPDVLNKIAHRNGHRNTNTQAVYSSCPHTHARTHACTCMTVHPYKVAHMFPGSQSIHEFWVITLSVQFYQVNYINISNKLNVVHWVYASFQMDSCNTDPSILLYIFTVLDLYFFTSRQHGSHDCALLRLLMHFAIKKSLL